MTLTLVSITLSNALAALLLAAIVLVVTRILRSPPLAHGLWVLVLLKLISPTILDVPLPALGLMAEPVQPTGKASSDSVLIPAPNASENDYTISDNSPLVADSDELNRKSIDSLPEGLVSPRVEISRDSNQSRGAIWALGFCVVWIVGVAIYFLLLAIRLGRFRKWLGKARPAALTHQTEIQHLATELGMRNVPDLREVDGVMPPLIWAMWGRPVVLIPSELLIQLHSDERRILLVHELAHLCRRDHWIRWLELIIAGLQWWQPVVWFARDQLHRATEQCCDAWVVRRFPQQKKVYAAALLKTVDFLSGARPVLPIGAAGFGEARLLKRRFEMILRPRYADRLATPARIGLAAIALFVLPLSLHSLWAGSPTPVANSLAREGDSDSPHPPTAIGTDSPQIELPNKASATNDVDQKMVDQRMQRLETMIERLTKIVESREVRETGSSNKEIRRTSDSTSIAAEGGPQRGGIIQWVKDVLSDSPALPTKLQNELEKVGDGQSALERLLEENRRELMICETLRNRAQAAKKQYELVKKAYEVGTVRLDQLLESQRSLVDGASMYADSVSRARNLGAKKQETEQRLSNLVKLGSLRDAEQQALQTWKEVHTKFVAGEKGGEPDKEAQAREQYFHLRARAKKVSQDLIE